MFSGTNSPVLRRFRDINKLGSIITNSVRNTVGKWLYFEKIWIAWLNDEKLLGDDEQIRVTDHKTRNKAKFKSFIQSVILFTYFSVTNTHFLNWFRTPEGTIVPGVVFDELFSFF